MLRSTTVFLGLLALALGCDGPFVMLPAGELSGTLQPVPSDWSFTDDFQSFQLETRPSDPYSVNVWGVGDGKQFFVVSGHGMENAWAQHIEADPNVRLRIGENLYELRALRSDDPLDRERFMAGAKKKYDDFEPDEEQSAAAVLYRLEPR